MNVSRDIHLQFWTRLAQRLSAGDTLGSALHELAPLAAPMQLLAAAVDRNQSLSDAMSAQGSIFPSVIIAMFRAGEVGGLMDIAAGHIAELYTRGLIDPAAPLSPETREQGACLCILGHMLSSGVAIVQAIELLAASQPPGAARLCQQLRDAALQQSSLVGALNQLTAPALQMIEKAEAEGDLDRALIELGRSMMNALPPDKLAASDSEETRKAVNLTLLAAVKARASDIHIDADGVRFRIDGVLHDQPCTNSASMIHRLKAMACLDLEQRQFPQDGRIGVRINNTDFDLRVSVVPTVTGERLVLRILRPDEHVFDLARVVSDTGNCELIRGMLRQPKGLLICTGPTGSGKTTLLYSMLTGLDSKTSSVFSIEDPVEVRLPGVAQVQVNPAIGLTFVRAARAIFRQDPDVVMVGEIRDLETAQLCCQMALTGHLVLSTLHTDDTTSGIGRILDIGVEPFVVGASVVGVIAQRLVRRLCPHCSRRTQVELASLPPDVQAVLRDSTPTFYAPGQCDQCNHTGYRGRQAIHEVLCISQDVRDAAARRASAADVRQIAIAGGMRTLRQDGALAAARGETTLEEVFRVTPGM